MLAKTLLVAFLFTASTVAAQDSDIPTLFINVHVFDGANEQRIENAFVLVRRNLIAEVSTEPLTIEGARIIDGKGRTLMPGLIDSSSRTVRAWGKTN